MASLVANAAVDMTDWNFNDIKNGSITTHSSFKYAISGADGHHFYQFTGSGLTYDANFKLTGGTVTGLKVVDDHGDTLYTLSGFTMAATLLKTTIGNGDSTGAFEGAAFGDNDTLTGSDHDDVLVGFAGQNVINGGAGDDIIDATKGTLDRVSGGDGDDTVFAGLLIGSIDGGAGYDNVVWNINTSYPLNLSSLFGNIERFTLLGGPNYFFRADDSFISANMSMTIDASALKSNARVYFDGKAEKDGSYEFIGSAGRDRFWSGDANDTFDMTTGGVDRVHGGAGTNTYFFGATLTADDRIDGTGGYDQLFLDGDYSAGLTFDSHTMRGVDVAALAAGHSYSLTLNDGNVAAGDTFTLLSLQLKGSDTVTFDGSAETDGTFTLSDGYGNDTLLGGQGNDQFISVGGTDVITGNAGDDLISFTNGAFDATDTVNGGAGTDELDLLGDYTDGVVFGANTVRGV
ncbi:MAG TPA: hypothetical protein VHL34_20155, partial [Rhizomicrobium sp.]|nr:hypothetical protein [Rhizomicrobium sp.]